MTDFRALCAELAYELDAETSYTRNDGTRMTHPTVVEARAALAQPEPQGPTDEELKAAYWEAFKNAAPCGAEQSWLAGLRAVACWDRPVIEPDEPAVPEGREPASVDDSLALRVQRLEAMRETEKAALLDAFRQIDDLKHRIDFQYFKLCRLEDAIDAELEGQ